MCGSKFSKNVKGSGRIFFLPLPLFILHPCVSPEQLERLANKVNADELDGKKAKCVSTCYLFYDLTSYRYARQLKDRPL